MDVTDDKWPSKVCKHEKWFNDQTLMEQSAEAVIKWRPENLNVKTSFKPCIQNWFFFFMKEEREDS